MIKVVLFCGGSGSSSLVKELASKSKEIQTTLIINPFDDGKSTGKIRELVPGLPGISDFRKNIVNASTVESAALLNTRVDDVAIGNGLIASLYLIYNNFQKSVDVAAGLFSVPVKILSITNDPAKLSATLENGEILHNEASIAEYRGTSKIKDLTITDLNEINEDCIAAIINADIIIYGAGTQHSSLYPTYLALKKFANFDISKVKARKFFVVNLEYEGDTKNWSVEDLINSASFYWGAVPSEIVDEVVVGVGSEFLCKNETMVECTDKKNYRKHDGEKLLKEILKRYYE